MKREQRVLVTGGTGMVGAALIRRLVGDGHHVTLLVRVESNRVRLQAVEERMGFVVGDIRDAASVHAAVQEAKPELVYHLASTAFNPPTISAQAHLDTITLGTLNLLEALKGDAGVQVIAAGSAAEYGSGSRLREEQPLRPATVLGAAKAAAALLLQAYARRYGMRTVVLRLFTPYGPWEHPGRLVPHTVCSALDGRDVPLTRGEQQRDFIYLDDVVDALLAAAARPLPPGSVFNIGSGIGVPVRTVVERVLELMGNPVKPLVGALPTRPDEIREMSADITAARMHLGWQPRTSLTEGLEKAITWWTMHREVAERLSQDAGSVPETAASR